MMNLIGNSTVVIVGIVLVTSLGLLSAISRQTATADPINMKLVVDTTNAKIQDLNNNKQPDAGEFVSIVGTLYATGTENEIGKYRCFFSWGGWANTTEGVSVTPAIQVFDIKGNGTIVAVGDEPSMDAEGKLVDAAIAGGTGNYKSITGIAGLTEHKMEGTKVPFDVVLDIKWP
ncbi:MAG: hypothetical protein E6L01_05800 [Thaumarchaeota archaeon]|nr:MAG: hypothetical protein E6L01_05800 [Nitrososphaerota archaeon]